MVQLRRLAFGLVAAMAAGSSAGCSTFLDFDHFAGGDGSLDGGAIDVGPVDAPGRDAPLPDTTVSHTLSVTVSGMGMVTSDPAGIACGAACSLQLGEGTTVTLTAAPDASSQLLEWTGGGCSGSATTCVVTLSTDVAVTATFARRGSVRWASQITYPGDDSFEHDLVVAPDGNVILGTTVDDGDGADLLVAKIDRATGEILWSTLIDTPTGEYYGGLAVGPDGNVYASATISGFSTTYVVAGTTFTGDIFGEIAVYALDGATGTIVWGVQWGGEGQDRPHGLAVDGNDLFVTGESDSTGANFGGFPVAFANGNGFLVRASTMTGGVNRVIALPGNLEITGVAANATNVAVAGGFSGNMMLDACGMHATGTGNDAFVASFVASDLSCTWARTAGDLSNGNATEAFAIASHPDGGWVTTGFMSGSVLFATSGATLASHGGFDVFAVRYGPTGDHVWSFRYGGAMDDLGTAVATTPTGEVVLTGQFQAGITFGAFDLVGPSDVFVTRMSAGDTPSHDWAAALGGDGPDRTEGVAVDPAGNVYVSAYFTGMTNVGGTAFTGAGYDTWIAALVP